MKVLYAAYHVDPRNPDLASGSDYHFYKAMERHGMDVNVVETFRKEIGPVEQVLKKFHKSVLKSKYAKFPLSRVRYASAALNRAEQACKPDVVFTIFPPPLVFYRGQAPCIYRLDTCFRGWHLEPHT